MFTRISVDDGANPGVQFEGYVSGNAEDAESRKGVALAAEDESISDKTDGPSPEELQSGSVFNASDPLGAADGGQNEFEPGSCCKTKNAEAHNEASISESAGDNTENMTDAVNGIPDGDDVAETTAADTVSTETESDKPESDGDNEASAAERPSEEVVQTNTESDTGPLPRTENLQQPESIADASIDDDTEPFVAEEKSEASRSSSAPSEQGDGDEKHASDQTTSEPQTIAEGTALNADGIPATSDEKTDEGITDISGTDETLAIETTSDGTGQAESGEPEARESYEEPDFEAIQVKVPHFVPRTRGGTTEIEIGELSEGTILFKRVFHGTKRSPAPIHGKLVRSSESIHDLLAEMYGTVR